MSERILLLEDDKYIQDLISMKCKLENIEIKIAKNVEEALQLVQDGTWDLTVIDIMFPSRSGVDIAEYILDKKLDMPFVFISAKNRAVFLEEFKSSISKYPVIGKEELYIMKPFDLDFLIKKIKEIIAKFRETKDEDA